MSDACPLPSPATPWDGAPKRNRFLFLVLPILVSFALWGGVWFVTGESVALQTLTAACVSLTLVGPTVILGPAVLGPGALPGVTLSTWQLAWIIAYMSVLMAFLFAYNLDLFERVPRLGDWLRRVRLGAKATLECHRWIRRLATLGVGVFVLLPLPGSGSLGGSIIGLLLGLGSLRTFLATGIAGVLVAFGYGWGGAALKSWLDAREIGTGPRVAGVLVMLVILVAIFRLLHRFSKHPAATGRSPASETGA